MKQAKLFNFIVDPTQGVSVLDQLVVRDYMI